MVNSPHGTYLHFLTYFKQTFLPDLSVFDIDRTGPYIAGGGGQEGGAGGGGQEGGQVAPARKTNFFF